MLLGRSPGMPDVPRIDDDDDKERSGAPAIQQREVRDPTLEEACSGPRRDEPRDVGREGKT